MKNIKSNYGFYVLTPITSAFFVTMIVFYLKGFSWLGNKMDEVMKNKTCIVIAHRLSTISKMDKII